MRRFSHFTVIGIVILTTAAACGSPSPPPSSSSRAAAAPERLARVFERYWDERISVQDVIAPRVLADSLDVEKRYLAQLMTISRDTLNDDERLSYDIFKRQRESAIEAFTYPGELLPINPFSGTLLRFSAASAEYQVVPMSAAQAERWLRGADDYVRWIRQAISNMQDGVLRGYTSPRAVIERALPLLERLASDTPSNVFYTPLRALPQDLAGADRERLSGSLRDAVVRRVLPATRALHDYLLRDYLPKTRSGLALAELPLGASWYGYRVRRAVGADAQAEEIHRIGLMEAERLKPRLMALRDSAAVAAPGLMPDSDAPAPSAGELSSAYQDLGKQVSAALPVLFADVPPVEYETRATDYIGLPVMPLLYRKAPPVPDGHGILYVNVREGSSKPVVAAYLQQAVPGLHYQSAIQRQRTDLPRFRRYGNEPAFVAGWALYAALLGDELGVNSGDADRYQALNVQMRCAAGLVVDTGLHALGWTRVQALEYLHAQMSIADGDAQALIDVYAAMPGDALSCAMGGMKFQALRTKAQQSLGARFDIHEFHSRLLRDGAMPLDILEAKMNAWMEAQK